MVHDLILLSPILLVAVTAFFVLVLDLLHRQGSRDYLGLISTAGFAISGVCAFLLWKDGAKLAMPYLASMIRLDPFALFFSEMILISGALIPLISIKHNREQGIDFGEYYVLLAFSLLGTLVMATSVNLIALFLGLEIMSLSIYVLCGIKRSSHFAAEAAMKYFILGAFASAFFLFGAAFLYGISGSLNFYEIKEFFTKNPPSANYLFPTIALLAMVVSFAFKVAAVPFHFWTPDVYEGAPVPVAGWMAAGVKAAAFAGMGRVFYMIFASGDFSEFPLSWDAVWLVLSILTMTAANLIALLQTNIKRVLAYSSIAHAGYILLGFYAAKNGSLNPAVYFYIATYIVATVGAFSVLSMLGGSGVEEMNLFTAAGLSKRRPFLALILLVCLFSLAGIPPTAGFLGKFYLFKEVLLAGTDKNLIFVIIAVLNSVVAAYYYLRIIVYMYMHEPSREINVISSIPAMIAMLIIAALILQLGLFPAPIIEFAEKASAL